MSRLAALAAVLLLLGAAGCGRSGDGGDDGDKAVGPPSAGPTVAHSAPTPAQIDLSPSDDPSFTPHDWSGSSRYDAMTCRAPQRARSAGPVPQAWTVERGDVAPCIASGDGGQQIVQAVFVVDGDLLTSVRAMEGTQASRDDKYDLLSLRRATNGGVAWEYTTVKYGRSLRRTDVFRGGWRDTYQSPTDTFDPRLSAQVVEHFDGVPPAA